MTPENLVESLAQYRIELTQIMSRFKHSGSGGFSGFHANSDDEPRIRTLVIEIIDLLNDSIGSNQYSPSINQIFLTGHTNFFRSQSYKSLESIVAILDSVITRIKRNPDLCNPKKENTSPAENMPLDHPAKVTLKWLYHNTSLQFWLWVASAFAAVFILGVSFGQSTLYHDLTTKTENPTNLKTHVTATIENTDTKTAAPIKNDALKK
jgi:hypothetical protein